jgi:hypothetical protein
MLAAIGAIGAIGVAHIIRPSADARAASVLRICGSRPDPASRALHTRRIVDAWTAVKMPASDSAARAARDASTWRRR